MTRRRTFSSVAILAGWLLALQTATADGPFPLDDAILDHVTAGTQEGPLTLAEFGFSRSTASGRTVQGNGTLALAAGAPDDSLYLGDGAQGNLRSLVNINAVDANVTVLLNLNINVNSTVEHVDQSNFTLRAADALRAAEALRALDAAGP